MGLSMPKVDDFLPLTSKCEKRLNNVSPFLNQAGRLKLTNWKPELLTALPTYTMCSIARPKIVIKQIDKYRKYYLWRGAEENARKVAKAARPLVCIPKCGGGPGVLNLQILYSNI